MGWTDIRQRRARMFTWLLLGAAVVALWSLTQVWFAWATPGVTPACSPVPAGSPTISVQISSGAVVDGVAARGCVRGSEVTGKPQTGSVGIDSARQGLNSLFSQEYPANIAGLPRAVVGLAAVGLLGALSVGIRKGWLGVVSLLVLQVPIQDAAKIRAFYLQDAGGFLTVTGRGLDWFTYMLFAIGVLTLAATIFVLRVNHGQRKSEREAALLRGEEPPPELLDPVLSYLGRKIGTVRDAANEHSRQQHVTSHPASAASQNRNG